jgi:hypothetical protein
MRMLVIPGCTGNARLVSENGIPLPLRRVERLDPEILAFAARFSIVAVGAVARGFDLLLAAVAAWLPGKDVRLLIMERDAEPPQGAELGSLIDSCWRVYSLPGDIFQLQLFCFLP